MTKRAIAAFTAAVTIIIGILSGCTVGNSGTAKQTVTVALWGNQLLENYAPWLQEQFPNVDFQFSVVNNSAGYYLFRDENDGLPDIMTIRRFSLRDVQPLKDKLMDLGDTELANSFYQSYLRSYTYADGTINWLPACAEIDDIIVNKTLFEKNNIPLPTDWDSFAYACKEFEKLGIRGYVSDFDMDYTCMETLQGFSINTLASSAGRDWRQQYESGLINELDRDVWLPAFEKMKSFIECTGITEENFLLDSTDIMNAFDRGEIAMYRGTGADLINYGKDYKRVMMPMPGDTPEESRYLTYPAFQIAASSRAETTEERSGLILEIMTAMLSEEGLSHISEGKNMIAYNKDINLELIPELENLKPYIEDNRIYIRLASSKMFSASQSVVQKMIKGEITTAEAAFDAFNVEMKDTSEGNAETAAVIGRDYSGTFDKSSGCEAASAVYNTLREKLGADCMLGSSTIVTGSIPAGEYTDKELKYLFNVSDGFLLKMRLTPERLAELTQYMLETKGTRDSVAGTGTLPATSGFETEISKTDDGYKLDRLTINGEEPNADTEYSVILRIRYEPDIKKLEEAGFTDYEKIDANAMNLLKEKLGSGGELSAPTDYIKITD